MANDGMHHHLKQAKAYMRVRDNENAKMESYKYIALYPKSPQGYMSLALAHYAEREYRMAQEALKKYMAFVSPSSNDDPKRTADMMELFVHREKFEKEELWSRCCYCGGACEKPMRCSACKYIHYCSTDCQVKHWNGKHKQLCISRIGKKSEVLKIATSPTQTILETLLAMPSILNHVDEYVVTNQWDKLAKQCKDALCVKYKDVSIQCRLWNHYAIALVNLGRHEDALVIIAMLFQYAAISTKNKVGFYHAAANINGIIDDNSACSLRYECIRAMRSDPTQEYCVTVDECLAAYTHVLINTPENENVYRYKKFIISDAYYLAYSAKIYLWEKDVSDTDERFADCYFALGHIHCKKMTDNVFEPTETREDVEWDTYFDLTGADKVFSKMEQTPYLVSRRRGVYIGLCSLYHTWQKYEDAVPLRRQIVEWSRDPKNDIPHLTVDICRLAESLQSTNQFDEARKYYEECRTRVKEIPLLDTPNKITLGYALYGLIASAVYSNTRDPALLKSALMYADELLSLSKENPDVIKSDYIKRTIYFCVVIRTTLSKK